MAEAPEYKNCIAAKGAVMRWQTMDTAPKDGSLIFIVTRYQHVEDYDRSIEIGFWGENGFDPGNECWRDWSNGDYPDEDEIERGMVDFFKPIRKPICWMPMPPFPHEQGDIDCGKVRT